MAENAVQRIKQLEQERSQLVAAAKKEALAKAHEAISDLGALGFNYHLVEKGHSAVRKGIRQRKNAPCPVCKFQTSPPHDARRHRGQGKRKRPFTAAQLTEFGLERA
jgi:hypothetical protein